MRLAGYRDGNQAVCDTEAIEERLTEIEVLVAGGIVTEQVVAVARPRRVWGLP